MATKKAPTLYSYCLRYDDGAAPNPFWGVCTLAICKPVVRRVADVGDWIVGTGSMKSLVGDTSGLAVYAMRVTEKLTLQEYDERTRETLRRKVPTYTSADLRMRVGDSIYDFSESPPALRPSVHDEGNRATDLSGVNVLLSSEFYYFGKNAVPLPKELLPIVKQGQGHRSKSNTPYVDAFVSWIRENETGVHGDPQMWTTGSLEPCGACRARDDEEDLKLGDEGC